jgi:hypothetical protein
MNMPATCGMMKHSMNPRTFQMRRGRFWRWTDHDVDGGEPFSLGREAEEDPSAPEHGQRRVDEHGYGGLVRPADFVGAEGDDGGQGDEGHDVEEDLEERDEGDLRGEADAGSVGVIWRPRDGILRADRELQHCTAMLVSAHCRTPLPVKHWALVLMQHTYLTGFKGLYTY